MSRSQDTAPRANFMMRRSAAGYSIHKLPGTARFLSDLLTAEEGPPINIERSDCDCSITLRRNTGAFMHVELAARVGVYALAELVMYFGDADRGDLARVDPLHLAPHLVTDISRVRRTWPPLAADRMADELAESFSDGCLGSVSLSPDGVYIVSKQIKLVRLPLDVDTLFLATDDLTSRASQALRGVISARLVTARARPPANDADQRRSRVA